MFLYNIKGNKLEEIKENKFSKEIELHRLCEENIETIFGLQFVAREFSINNFRIDTLAFDRNTNSFVIIEYKNKRNFSVIDQGYAYLSLMINNKSDFILEYNESCDDILKRDGIDWSQSRVIFVSPIFNSYQKESINFKDLPIELWEVKKFENNTIYFKPIKTSKKSESIKSINTSNNDINIVNQEIKSYTEDEHFLNCDEDILEIYREIKEYIISLDEDIEIKPKKLVIGFSIKNKIFIDILVQKKKLKIFLNAKYGEIDDIKNLSKDMSNTGHWGNGDYEIQVSDISNIEYIFNLINQAYKLKL
ncbi:DUF5655 domain-containing protein [Paraclostridium bifermentans]|uniref:DUF5655 domain-containing protein n=1 Tax=Paraclostridium bifermentans TaxID=1490 RepID=UPI0018983AAB|nr:DUF5655 domain-containing protein [Paraclostridium bifermentans]